MKSPMLLALCVLAASGPALAAQAGNVIPAPAAMRFVAVDASVRSGAAGDAWVELGGLRARHGPGGKAITVRKRIGLHLQGPSDTARVSVSLATEQPGRVVRVDGRRLSSLPQVIDHAHRVGATVVHDIEITIAADVPAGPMLDDLVWTAEHR